MDHRLNRDDLTNKNPKTNYSQNPSPPQAFQNQEWQNQGESIIQAPISDPVIRHAPKISQAAFYSHQQRRRNKFEESKILIGTQNSGSSEADQRGIYDQLFKLIKKRLNEINKGANQNFPQFSRFNNIKGIEMPMDLLFQSQRQKEEVWY